MVNRRSIVDFLLVLGLSALVFLTCISQNRIGLWEPWETSTLLAAQQMAQSNINEYFFWIPQVHSTLVAQPLLQLFSLVFTLHLSPEPDAFLLRLPGAIVGMLLVVLTFLTVRQISTRRAAWITAAVLLTLPMFALGGKFIHGDIWLILAAALPGLFFLLASYASTRRFHRTMLVFSGLSFFVSFLAGGLFAIAILLLQAVLFGLFMLRHADGKAILKPLTTQYFLVSLFAAFVASACVFGTIVHHSRYALELRTPLTLSEINEALDDDRIISIERRGTQIIGTYHDTDNTDGVTQVPFILVEAPGNLTTNATRIFQQNESERRAFVNDLMWRFQKKTPSRAQVEMPPLEGAFENALAFFWYHTNSPVRENNLPLVRAHSAIRVFNSPVAQTDASRRPSDNISEIPEIPAVSVAANHAQERTLEKDQLVRVLHDDGVSERLEIQDGAMQRGFVNRDQVSPVDDSVRIHWTSWLDIMLYGMFPWACFFPIVVLCIFVSPQKLTIAGSPFIGEFAPPLPEDDKHVTPVQWFLLAWLLTGIIALFLGINQSHRYFFVGVIPFAMLMGIALSSHQFWRAIRQSLEARLALMLFAFATLFAAEYAIYREPFRFVRYLLADPFMHWGVEKTLPSEIIVFSVIFVILTLVAFTSIAENIQTYIQTRREQRKSPKKESTSCSGTGLTRVYRDFTTMSYAPAAALILLSALSSGYIYFYHLPNITHQFTETDLVNRYFDLADRSEPLYLLSGENAQLCQTYRDCDAGYVCQNSRCRISTFASYSLNVAKPVSRDDMLHALTHNDSEPAFYIIPKASLFDINAAYRAQMPDHARRNLTVIDAPSARLYLIGNHEDLPSVNPLDRVFLSELPKNASPLPMAIDNDMQLLGFRIDKLDFEREKTLRFTLFYSVKQPLLDRRKFLFSLNIGSRNQTFEHALLPQNGSERLILPNDIVADEIELNTPLMPQHGILSVGLTTSQQSDHFKNMTTIDF